MKILYICADRGIPVRGHKGAAVHVRAMCAAFTDLGHQVVLMTPRPGPDDGPPPAAELVDAPLPPLPHGMDKATARDIQSQNLGPQLLAAARTRMARDAFDLIYERYSLWSDVGARLARETGVPLVLEVNAPLADEATRFRHLSDAALARRIEATQLQGADHVIVVSQALAEHAISRGASPEQVHVQPNCIDPRAFHPAVRGGHVRRRLGLHGKYVVGFVGRPRPWHDLDTLLDAFARLHAGGDDYHLLLVGEMPESLAQRLEEMGIAGAVTMTGPVPHDEVPAHIAAMNVATSPHPDLDDFYFSPLKLVEYQACGVPAVAAAVGQPAQQIRHGDNGLLYPPGDATALATAIRALRREPAEARAMAWRAAAGVLSSQTWQGNAADVCAWIAPPTGAAETSTTATALPLIDEKLRQRLYRATRPDLARPLLARRLPTFHKKGPARLKQVTAIDVLKYKPRRRCVLGYTLRGKRRDGSIVEQRVVGKVFRDERGRRLHQIHQLLQAHGFGPDADDGIIIPASLAYVPEMRMQVQQQLPGRTLNELLADGPPAAKVALAARGLAKLHSTRLPDSAVRAKGISIHTYLLGDELHNIDRFTRELCTRRPAAGPTINALRDGLVAWAERLPALPVPVPVHRDFYYSQVLFDGDRLALIDFDLFAYGDPALDVANFIAHLRFMAHDLLARPHALDDEAALFLETYEQHGRAVGVPLDPAFRQRVAFYEAATAFRLLNVVAPRPGLVHLFPDLLQWVTGVVEPA